MTKPSPVPPNRRVVEPSACAISFGATLPNIDAMGWGGTAQFRIRVDRGVIGDHALLV